MTGPTADHERRLIDVAGKSPCRRDQRGALLVDPLNGAVIASGWNAPPWTMTCEQMCREPLRSCAGAAEHAEAMAIRNTMHRAMDPGGQHIIHGKVVDGRIVESRPPEAKTCKSCAVLMITYRVAAIWLFTDRGWQFWRVSAYHRLAAAGCS